MIRCIEIHFPVPIEISALSMNALHDSLSKICKEYEESHHDRAMWVFGWGIKPVNILKSDDETFYIRIIEQEKSK
jgi:hypothetical protein